MSHCRPLRSRRLSRALVLAGVTVFSVAWGSCGKKGPPLAPLVQLPGRAEDLLARRLGDRIYVRFTVPAANIDGTTPVDLDVFQVYAYTAYEAAEARDLKRATLIATVPVSPPPDPDAMPGEEPGQRKARKVRPGEVAPGTMVGLVETVTPEMLVPLPPDPKAPKPNAALAPAPAMALPMTPFAQKPEPRRFYVAVGLNRKGDRGGMSPRPFAMLGAAPPAPDAPVAKVTEQAIVLTWKPPTGLRMPYQARPAAAKTIKSTLKGMPPGPTVAYWVYRVPPPGAAPPSGDEAQDGVPWVDVPFPLGKLPTSGTSFSDPIDQWGAPQCYVVRSLEAYADASIESAASPVTCITPKDTFPPSPPTALAAIASEGAISLIWDPVSAPDLAGYVVMRATAPDGTFAPLFDTPIRETTYRDAATKPGVRYMYEVVAVDNATAPNRSLPSNRVTEAAR